MEDPVTKPWSFYIIYNDRATYAGVSPDPVRRLRQHNGEIKGGAKYTTSKGPGWKHICIISGFQDKIQSMQFEWAVKHVAPRNAGGITNRIKKLYEVFYYSCSCFTFGDNASVYWRESIL